MLEPDLPPETPHDKLTAITEAFMKRFSNAIATASDAALASQNPTTVALGVAGKVASGILDAYFDYQNAVAVRRLEHFVALLQADLACLDHEKVSRKSLESEEFLHYFDAALRQVARLAARDRVLRLRDAVVSAVAAPPDNLEFAERMDEILVTLNESEVQVLASLNQAHHHFETKYADDPKTRRTWDCEAAQYVQSHYHGDKAAFDLCFETLVAKSLAYDDSFGRWDTPARTFIRPTPLGVAVIDYLTRSADCAREVRNQGDSATAAGTQTE